MFTFSAFAHLLQKYQPHLPPLERIMEAITPTDVTLRMVRLIVLAIVDDMPTVRVTAHPGEFCTVIRVEVAASDIGKVIGKQGRTARSLRTLINAAAMKLGTKYALDILSPAPLSFPPPPQSK
jgi:predicted RNA-binding protein YlqC (UPF0109 family)